MNFARYYMIVESTLKIDQARMRIVIGKRDSCSENPWYEQIG